MDPEVGYETSHDRSLGDHDFEGHDFESHDLEGHEVVQEEKRLKRVSLNFDV